MIFTIAIGIAWLSLGSFLLKRRMRQARPDQIQGIIGSANKVGPLLTGLAFGFGALLAPILEIERLFRRKPQ